MGDGWAGRALPEIDVGDAPGCEPDVEAAVGRGGSDGDGLPAKAMEIGGRGAGRAARAASAGSHRGGYGRSRRRRGSGVRAGWPASAAGSCGSGWPAPHRLVRPFVVVVQSLQLAEGPRVARPGVQGPDAEPQEPDAEPGQARAVRGRRAHRCRSGWHQAGRSGRKMPASRSHTVASRSSAQASAPSW